MKNSYKGAIAFGIVALLAVSFVAANGLGIGHAFGQLSETEKETAKTNMDAIRTAIKNNDYDAWKTAMEVQIAMMQDQITEENFNALVEQHNEMSQVQAKIQAAKDAGDTETLKALQEQYGFGKGMRGNGQGRGIGQGIKGNCPMADAAEDSAE